MSKKELNQSSEQTNTVDPELEMTDEKLPDAIPDMKPEAKPEAPAKHDEPAKRGGRLKHYVLLSLFVGLIILLGMTPIGMIPLGFINVTILAVPVVVGTLLLGWKEGLVLGAAFGGVSFANALMKPSALVSTLMGASPVYVFLMSVLPRLCVPLVAWIVYRFFERRSGSVSADYLTSSVCGCLFNVLVFLVVPQWFPAAMDAKLNATLTALIGFAINVLIGFGMFRLLGMKEKSTAVSAVCGSLTNTVLYLGLMLVFYIIAGLDNAKVLTLIGGTALLAGSAEAAVAGILCTPILKALRRLK